MKKKEFVKKYRGQDKIPGRPVRLNKISLEPRQNKDYAEVIFWGDIHFGYPTSNLEKAEAMSSADIGCESFPSIKTLPGFIGPLIINGGLPSSFKDFTYAPSCFNPSTRGITTLFFWMDISPVIIEEVLLRAHSAPINRRIIPEFCASMILSGGFNFPPSPVILILF